MEHMGGCQNYGPFWGPLNNRCRIILRTQQGTLILTTTHIASAEDDDDDGAAADDDSDDPCYHHHHRCCYKVHGHLELSAMTAPGKIISIDNQEFIHSFIH